MSKPFWIQIELDVKGVYTSAVQIDLSRIQRVQIIRKYGKAHELKIRYDNEVLVLPPESIPSFMEHWETYQPLQASDEPRQWSNIEVAESDFNLYSLNPKIR